MNILRELNRRLTSERFDKGLGRIACYVAAIFVQLLGLNKLVALDLTEAQIFFGVLLVGMLSLQLVALGTLSGYAREPSRANELV